VDVKHFSQARSAALKIPDDARFENAQGVLGYFGVVDERLDYDLLAALAGANPNWHVVLIGPTCKIHPNVLPQAPNFHWLGRREYSQLPAYTKGFDICLMPFAMNEATEYINPTKALEYMAAGRPIVSTPVPDVVSNFSKVVKIAPSQEEFIQMCRQEVLEPDQAAIQRGLQMAEENQWETIVQKLEGHIADVLNGRQSRRVPADDGALAIA
jgi:glycosyltransferase involved in cell wall biosynthesis